MNPSRLFVARPVATTLLTIAVALLGAAAFAVLPVSPLPQVDFPTISVSALLPGASPDIMASSVATPLERQFGHIAGITEMTSSSSLGATVVTLQFDLSRDIDGAARDVEAGINAARTYLPANLPANPTYRKVNPADSPILVLGLQSDIYDVPTLYDEASSVLEQRISQVPGVGQVVVVGASLPAVRIELDPARLSGYGIGLPAVQQLVAGQNADMAKGQLSNAQVTSDIVANDQISHAADYKPLIVGYNKGAAVHLSDVADVVDSQQSIRQAGFLNGERSVDLIVYRQPGANIIATVDAVKAALPSLQATIPRGEHLVTVLDRTLTIRASVGDIERTLIISVVLVIAVVFLFLRDARATLIPAVAVPVSLIGTCAIMYLCGFSLDNLSLMALAIASGFVVDDAIVVMENIARHLEEGLTPVQAALEGAQEIGFTVLSISISLIAVFIPLLLMGGIIGRLFREFAITLSSAVLVSMVVSLTTTPMMCSRILMPEKDIRHGRLYAFSERLFTGALDGYRRSLAWVLDRPGLLLGVFVLTLALNAFLIAKIPKGFFPHQDTGAIRGGMQGPQDTSFDAMRDALLESVRIIQADPGVQNVMGFTGGQGATNSGFEFIALKPLNERKASAEQIIDRLRPKLARVPGAATFLQPVQDIRIGGRQSNAEYQYTLQADTSAALQTYGPRLLAALRKAPGFLDVNTDQQNNGLQALLTYDRPTAARLGVTPQVIDNTLYHAFGQSEISTIYTPLNQYYVVMEVAPEYWQTPEGLKDIYLLPTSGKGSIPLDAVTRYSPSTAPLVVNHTGLFPSVTVSFNLAPGVSLGQATREIQAVQRSLGMPPSIHGQYSGALQAFRQSLKTEPYLILSAIIAVYIVLGMLYESLVHPATILSTLPPASVGAVGALLLARSELDVMSIIGIILLIGIVKKNAIMMIDFALSAERNQGKSTREAIFEAATLRFRPIMMTTMAALLGAVPLAIGTGIGSELRRPLGIAIVGGLIVSQVLTLYSTPVIYLLTDTLRLKLRGLSGRGLAAIGIGLLGGCAAPEYHVPAVSTPEAFKESSAAAYQSSPPGTWQPARPQDALLKGKWWEVFGEPELNALEEQLNISNQTIAQAFQNFMAARAQVREARAGYYPTVTTSPSYTKGRSSGATGAGASLATGSSSVATGGGATYQDISLPFDVSWEPDLWGRIRDTVHEYQYAAQVSAADLENQRLTEQADLAVYYFELRGQDALQDLYDRTIAADKQSLELTRALLDTGIDSPEDVAGAEVTLANAQATAIGIATNRALYEHAIATLIGRPASGFCMAVKPLTTAVPAIPVGVPSQLLQRRPDIAAAERTMAQANALIGVEMTAYYPTLDLTASGGFESSLVSTLFTAPARFWTLGASASETIFDGGLRKATLAQYQAQYNADVASYRQTVLTAFQQVEDYISTLRVLSQQIESQQVAVSAAQRYLDVARSRYQTGLDPYLNVMTAQVTLLTDQQTEVTLRVSEMVAAVELVQALGGGWDVTQLPTAEQVVGTP
jgi:multidrug efflux pump